MSDFIMFVAGWHSHWKCSLQVFYDSRGSTKGSLQPCG